MFEWLPLSFLYRVTRDLYAFFRGRRRRLTGAQRLEFRDKWRPEFEEKLREYRRNGYGRDVIVHDVARLDEYPNAKEKSRGISAWFRAGFLHTDHAGILLGLQWTRLMVDGETGLLRYPNRKKGEEGTVKCMLAGHVRYENVQSVNWDGDEYYQKPHFFLHFDGIKHSPYSKVGFYEQRFLDEFEYWTEIAEQASVIKLSKRSGVKSRDMY